MTYTDEELIIFSQQPDIEFVEIDSKSSIKSNIFILARNFINLKTYLDKLKAYVKYVNGLIDVDFLINAILARFQTNKINISIDSTLVLNEIVFQSVNTISYKIERISAFKIEISNVSNPEWVTDNLIVQVKNVEGSIVYPVIVTKNNKITIHFIDGITVNYVVFFI